MSAPEPVAGFVDNADRRHPLERVQSDIAGHRATCDVRTTGHSARIAVPSVVIAPPRLPDVHTMGGSVTFGVRANGRGGRSAPRPAICCRRDVSKATFGKVMQFARPGSNLAVGRRRAAEIAVSKKLRTAAGRRPSRRPTGGPALGRPRYLWRASPQPRRLQRGARADCTARAFFALLPTADAWRNANGGFVPNLVGTAPAIQALRGKRASFEA